MGGSGEQGIVIGVLGSPRLERDGAAIRFDTRKATALLAYLAVTDRPQRREALAALFWPDADETRARSALRRTLSVVKQGLGEGALRVTRDELALDDGAGMDIDVRRFLAGLASDDVDEVATAASLWRGDLLAGFTLRDSAPFDEWQGREAERLRRALGAASARLVDACASSGRTDDALIHAQRWLELDPLHEPAHRAIMRLHAERGDRAAAVHQYRQCVRTMDDELGVAPLEETTALYEAIAAGAIRAPASTSAVPAPVPAAGGRYPLTGRTAETAALRAAIRPGSVVVIEGEPGVGKTRLVEEVLSSGPRPLLMARCYDNDGDVPYGPLVELLRLAATDPDAAAALASLPPSCAAEVARLVPELAPDGAEVIPDDGPGADARFLDGVARAVLAAGSTPSGILVVDDAQWADDASQQVLAHLVHRSGDDGPCLVVTIRTGEVGDAGPLAHALADRLRSGRGVAIRLGRLDRGAVAELVAGCVADDVELRTEEVVRESEGLPFLVVAYLDALVGGNATSVDVGDLIRNRLASLTDGAAQLLVAAAVIGRSFSFDVVRAASGRSDDEAVAGLDELVARGLVDERATPDGLTYDFAHGQVRRFVYDHTSLARRRLLHHRVADALLSAPRQTADPASVAAAVAHHERQAGRDDLAAEQFRLAGDHARAVYANADARGHYDAALALGHPAVAELHEAIGDLETLDGRFAAAVASYERAAARHGPDDLARVEGKLGGVHQRRGHWSTAEGHYEAALAVLGPDGPASARARVTADLAITSHRQGHTDRAAELAADGVRLAEQAGDDAAIAHTGTVAGLLAAGRGDLVTARELLTGSLDRADRLGDPFAWVAAANGLARVLREADAAGASEQLLRDAVLRCAAIGDRHREAALRDHLAQVLHERGQPDEAMDQLKQAVAIFADIGVEGGSIQTEIWRLTEWVDQGSGPSRNDLGTSEADEGGVLEPIARRSQP